MVSAGGASAGGVDVDAGGKFRVGRLFTGARDRQAHFYGRSGPLYGRIDDGWGR